MPDISLDRAQQERPHCRLVQSPDDSFVAIDIETANAEISSICQIAAVEFVGGRESNVWHSLVNPEAPFNALNVGLHGINASAVRNAPIFSSIADTLLTLLSDRVVVSHTPFDRISLERACRQHGIPLIKCRWLDTARVVRRAWPRFARRGYGLRSVASWCGIEFRHHDAVEDANAAGRILALAVAETDITLEAWLHCCPTSERRVRQNQSRDRSAQLAPSCCAECSEP